MTRKEYSYIPGLWPYLEPHRFPVRWSERALNPWDLWCPLTILYAHPSFFA